MSLIRYTELMRYCLIIILVLLFSSCDSSIKEFNVGFNEGYKEGLKSNGCKEFRDKRKQWKNKSFKDGFMKGYDSGIIDCIKIKKAQEANL